MIEEEDAHTPGKVRERTDSNLRKRSGTEEIKLRTSVAQEFGKLALKKTPAERPQDSNKNSDRQSSKHQINSPSINTVNDKDMTTEEIRLKIIDAQLLLITNAKV